MPTRDDLLRKLEGLCAGTETRDEVSEWATAIIDDSSLKINDQVVWQVLKRLGAVDLIASDRDYLYTIEDFEEWRAELLSN
jgi:hypothetical protein